MNKHKLSRLVGLALTACYTHAFADNVTNDINSYIPRSTAPEMRQVVPNREELKRPEKPAKTKESDLKITVGEFIFIGNEVISTEDLQRIAKPYLDRSIGINELNKVVADVISAYRRKGYMLAQAYLPEKSLVKNDNGHYEIDINIFEGSLGDIFYHANDNLKIDSLKSMLSYGLDKGEPITEQTLLRNVMLVNSLPGIKASASLNPGDVVGSSNIEYSLEPENKFQGFAAYNNYGNIYTGRNVMSGGIFINNLVGYGDQFGMTGRFSDTGNFHNVNLLYSTPINRMGDILTLSYSRVDYALGDAFKALKATGTSDYYSGYYDHYLYRDGHKGLAFRAGGNYKLIKDEIELFGSSNYRNLKTVELNLHGDWINDDLNVAYQGSVSLIGGNVHFMDPVAALVDKLGNKTAGDFQKFYASLTRTQYLKYDFVLTARLDGQLASKNLDSAEKFGIGSATRWRGYSYLSSISDEGYLANIELRKNISANWGPFKGFSPYVSYDYGKGSVNVNAATSANMIETRLSTVGVDAYLAKGFTVNVAATSQARSYEGSKTATYSTVWAQIRKDF